MHATGKATLCILLFILFLTQPLSVVSATQTTPEADYRLAITFDLAAASLTGTAMIKVESGQQLSLFTGNQRITGILIQYPDGSTREAIPPSGQIINLPEAPHSRWLLISYTLKTEPDSANLISVGAVSLLNAWHPVPSRKMRFQIDATLPGDFQAVVESDSFPLSRNGKTVSASYSEPVKALHFVAAPYSISSLDVREGLAVHGLFFAEDQQLAPDYLKKAKEYINRYEQEIGQFPYNHYVITEGRMPTGLGMPTFTLLGQSVVRLPFIKEISLGHEVLHSWFGNSVEVNYAEGNWCEGLTTYLADHAYREDAGEGIQYRKEAMVNYLSYVHGDLAQPLSVFSGASHDQPLTRATRAIGYSRSLMLFHELRNRIGAQSFSLALKELYHRYRSQTASWKELQAVFEQISGQNLDIFFSERLHRKDIPDLSFEQVEVRSDTNGSHLTFVLRQNTATPYDLMVPVSVRTGTDEYTFTHSVRNLENRISIRLPDRPLSFTIDPEYSFMRNLGEHELTQSWSRFMGSSRKLVLVNPETREAFAPLLEQLMDETWSIEDGNRVLNSELRDADLLLLGLEQRAVNNLFGTPAHPNSGFTLDVRGNPLNSSRVAVLVSASDKQHTATLASRLIHYGKYTFLHFGHGHAHTRKIADTAHGLQYTLEHLPAGGPTTPITSFPSIIEQLAQNDVVYIGETHDSVSDHRLQLRIIEALFKVKPDLAIGMEMFPSSSQPALDRYVLGDRADLTEREFLKQSRYFDAWRYDYRYFREIIGFARNHAIPVLGLNLERSIVSNVYRTGSTDGITDSNQHSIPQERDLDLPGYAERLRAMHSVHQAGNHGTGLESGFIQAQALWDETMASNIALHLKDNPGRTVVVLAGSQHTRKDSGIPPRVARRIAVRQASVINLASGSIPPDLSNLADYFFLAEPAHLPSLPKLGIHLQEEKSEGMQYIEIISFSPGSLAKEAGLKEGDRIVEIDGYPIASMEDIRIAMLDARAGEEIAVQVQRSVDGGNLGMSYSVKPVELDAAPPHPMP